MKLAGPLSVAAGILLAIVTLLQAGYLSGSATRSHRRELRAEIRGLSAALLWRMKSDLVLHDHNRPSMERALRDLIETSPLISGAGLSTTDNTLLARSGKGLDNIPRDLVAGICSSRPEDLPLIMPAGAGHRLAVGTRFQLGSREMILTAVSETRPSPDIARASVLAISSLAAGLSAALLLVIRGIIETARKRAGRKR